MNYKRIMYKISGEALTGGKSFGHDLETMLRIGRDIKVAMDRGIQICVVVGGGNICRGAELSKMGIERGVGDYVAMLATVMNAVAMQNVMENKLDIPTRVMSALTIKAICEPYTMRRALRHLEKNRVVIFAAGTGNPFFTTDTAATLRAIEMKCEAIFKGTSVDGVYSSDPKKDPNAIRYEKISHLDSLSKELKFMDSSAISLAKDQKMPVIVFSIKDSESPLCNVLDGKEKFTIIE